MRSREKRVDLLGRETRFRERVNERPLGNGVDRIALEIHTRRKKSFFDLYSTLHQALARHACAAHSHCSSVLLELILPFDAAPPVVLSFSLPFLSSLFHLVFLSATLE